MTWKHDFLLLCGDWDMNSNLNKNHIIENDVWIIKRNLMCDWWKANVWKGKRKDFFLKKTHNIFLSHNCRFIIEFPHQKLKICIFLRLKINLKITWDFELCRRNLQLFLLDFQKKNLLKGIFKEKFRKH
jgi:hypothetical protein